MNESDEFFERMRVENPEAYQKLLDSLPDVRDGLNRQQRSLLMTMHRANLTHDAHMMSTAYVCYNTPAVGLGKEPVTVRAKLRQIQFDENGEEKERLYTPDLF